MGGAQNKKHGAGEISLHARFFVWINQADGKKADGAKDGQKGRAAYTALDISQSHQSR